MFCEKDCQENLQFWLLIVSVIMIPWMLIPKPCIEVRHLKDHDGGLEHQNSNDMKQPLVQDFN